MFDKKTKREIYSIIIASGLLSDTHYGASPEGCATDAIAYADEIIKRINEDGEKRNGLHGDKIKHESER